MWESQKCLSSQSICAPVSVHVVQSVLETQSPGGHKEKRVHGKKVTQTTNHQQHQTKGKPRQDAKEDKPHDLLFARHACQVRTEEIFLPFKVYWFVKFFSSVIETGRVSFGGSFPLKTLLEESFPAQARLTVAGMLVSDWAPITDKHSNKMWNCFVVSGIPGALSPVLEKFHRRFSWPNWPPLGLRGWAILSLWNFMPLTTQCRAP